VSRNVELFLDGQGFLEGPRWREARTAFEVLLARMRKPVLEQERVPWLRSIVFRGPARLRFGRA